MHLEGAQSEPVMCRNENNRGHRTPAKLFQHAETVQFGHLHVEKHEVRLLFADGGQRFVPVGALAHDFNIGFLLQQFANPLPRQRLVIHNECANFHALPSMAMVSMAGGNCPRPGNAGP